MDFAKSYAYTQYEVGQLESTENDFVLIWLSVRIWVMNLEWMEKHV